MAIIIENIDPDEDKKATSEHLYHVRVNNNVICEFSHMRKKDGLAQCLRDAADAVDKAMSERKEVTVDDILALVGEHTASFAK